MDITVNTFYYVLKGVSGRYQVYRRDQVAGPLLSAEPVTECEQEADAQKLADKLNREQNSRKVTI